MDAQLVLAFSEVNAQLHAIRTLLNGDNADNSALSTTAQGNLVLAINELFVTAGNAAVIDNSSTTTAAWSASKILAEIQASRDSLIGGAPATFDTMIELMNEIIANDGDISTAVADIAANAVLAQQGVDDAATAQAKADANETAHNNLVTALGSLTTDYAALVSAGL